MSDLTISIPPDLQRWLDHRIAEGRHVDAAEFVRDLLRRDMATADRDYIRAMIEEGLASGIDPREPEDVLDAIMAEDADFRA